LESDSDSLLERVGFVLSEHRLVVYGALGVFAVWMSGYVVDLLAGPYSESTELAHTISGLLGATAMVLALCGALVSALWAVLILSNRRT
jgi:hypothetical protein